MIRKIWKNRSQIFRLPLSVYYNFKCLPFNQAIKLPISIYKGSIVGKGKIHIDSKIKFGMIRLGYKMIPLLPNNGCKILLDGDITFKGECFIGNNSVLSIGNSGHLYFGDKIFISAGLQMVCYNSIRFADKVLIGWNCSFMDTDFHMLKYVPGGGYSKGYGSINIGENVWIANSVKIYKNVTIPANCVIASDSIICSRINCEEYTLLGNDRGIKILREGVFRDRNDDKIEYD